MDAVLFNGLASEAEKRDFTRLGNEGGEDAEKSLLLLYGTVVSRGEGQREGVKGGRSMGDEGEGEGGAGGDGVWEVDGVDGVDGMGGGGNVGNVGNVAEVKDVAGNSAVTDRGGDTCRNSSEQQQQQQQEEKGVDGVDGVEGGRSLLKVVKAGKTGKTAKTVGFTEGVTGREDKEEDGGDEEGDGVGGMGGCDRERMGDRSGGNEGNEGGEGGEGGEDDGKASKSVIFDEMVDGENAVQAVASAVATEGNEGNEGGEEGEDDGRWDMEGFKAEVHADNIPFLERLFATSMFQLFVTERRYIIFIGLRAFTRIIPLGLFGLVVCVVYGGAGVHMGYSLSVSQLNHLTC
jgi:hypothetical protein